MRWVVSLVVEDMERKLETTGGREMWSDLTRAWQERLGRKLTKKANSGASRTELGARTY